MYIHYDIPKLDQIINDIYVLTGLSINFLDINYQHLSKRQKEYDYCVRLQTEYKKHHLCKKSDGLLLEKCCKSKQYECHICHAGLYDAAIPVIKNDVIVGYVIMGRIRSSQSPECVDIYEDEYLSKLYKNMPYFSDEQIVSLRSLLQNIVFQSAIHFDYDPIMTEITSFVEREFRSDLRINTLCSKFHISKNYLYREFQKYYGMTVNEYITNIRIKKAKEQLEETTKPIYEICEDVGIDNYTYFCRLFKKETELTPGEYRKRYRIQHAIR